MTAEAMESSSAVVTPATARSRTAARASATTRPARRMSSTCSGVLYSIRSRPNMTASAGGGGADRRDQALGDVVHVADAVHLREQAAVGVDLGDRGGFLGVHVEAVADHVLGVVLAALDLGALEQPAHDDLGVRGDLDREVERQPGVGQDLLE